MPVTKTSQRFADPDAFVTDAVKIARHYYSRLSTYLSRDDVESEAMFGLFIASFNPKACEKKYLLCRALFSAKNLVMESRSLKKNQAVQLSAITESVTGDNMEVDFQDKIDPFAHLKDNDEWRDELDARLGKIAPREAEAIRLRYFEGLTLDQAAQRMVLHKRSVASMCARGIVKLRAIMAR